MIGTQPDAPKVDYENLPETMGIDRDGRISDKLHKLMRSKNIAEDLDKKKLEQIGRTICSNTKIDDDSRSEWKKILEQGIEVINMVQKEKTFPWPKAANVKIPMVLNAGIQFNARVLPQLIKGDQVVMFDVMKPDPTDEEAQRADRKSKHMSYQLFEQCDDWMMDKDKMLTVLAFAGNAFTKTYRDHAKGKNITEFCQPEDIIINQNVKNLRTAPRITHRMERDVNFILSKQRSGEYLDISLSELQSNNSDDDSSEYGEGDLQYSENITAVENFDETEIDYSAIHVFLEQHLWIDLDGDGYQEPYIAIVHKESEKVLRLVARYDETSFVFSKEEGKEDKYIEIIPIRNFTRYIFMPSHDGGFWGLGFAHILAPINKTANSVLNRLLDAGTLSNQQSGFLGKGLRMRKGNMRLIPGEWKQLDNAPGSSIKDNVVPLPVKEPSMVLFQLLGELVKWGDEISSVSDVMQGQSPAAGTPATTVINLIQQGMKVFGAVLIRLYHSLKSEYEIHYQLNKKYLTESEYYRSALGSGMIEKGDYQADDYGVFPVADPNLSVDSQILMKAQALYEAKDDPNINSREATLRYLEAIKIPNINKVIAPPPDPNAPPPPEVLNIMADTDNKHADTSYKIASVHKMAEDAHLAETKELRIAAVDGATVAEMKIDSGIKIAEAEQAFGEQAVQEGIQDEQMIEQGSPVEQIVEQMAQQEEQEAQQGQAPEQGGGVQPGQGGAPQPGPAGQPPGPGELPPAVQEALGGQQAQPGGLGETTAVGGKQQD